MAIDVPVLNTLTHCDQCQMRPKSGCAPIPSHGNKDAKLLVLTDHPSALDAKYEQLLADRGGSLLHQVFSEMKIPARKLYYLSALMCAPEDFDSKRPATVLNSLTACKDRLYAEIRDLPNRKVILALGNAAVQALTGKPANIMRTAGRVEWHEELQVWVVYANHPKQLLVTPEQMPEFRLSLQRARQYLTEEPGKPTTLPTTKIVAQSASEALQLLASLTKPLMSTDIETDGFDFRNDPIIGIGFCQTIGTAILIPGILCYQRKVKAALKALYEDKSRKFVWHNGKFDAKFIITQLGIDARIDEDTMLMHYLLDERSGDSGGYHDLKGLAQKYCNAPEWEADIKKYLPSKSTPYSAIPHEVRMTYHAYDCDYTLRLYYELDKLHALEPKSVRGYPQPIEAAPLLYGAANALARVEMYGALIDRKALQAHRTRMEAELDTLAAQVKANIPEGAMFTGPLFSINSPKQISHILYNVLGMPPYEDPKVSETSTASKVLRAYQDRHPFIYHLARYREISHLYKVYIKGFEERLDEESRLHTEYNLHGTTTGRLSSRNPNLQNVPRDSIIKQLFVAPPGYVFCNADYKQLEVRVGAYYSQDKQLIADLGKDLHWEVATQVFADFVGRFQSLVQSQDIDGLIALADSSTIMTDVAGRIHHTKREDLSVQKLHDWIRGRLRFATKFITFGILYGRGAASLADKFNGLGCTLDEAQSFLRAWHKRYPDMSNTMHSLELQAEQHGWVETPRGRRRRFPMITDLNQWAIKHQAVNMPIQSWASDMTLESLTILERELPARGFGHVVLTVHDAIAFELKEDRLDESTHLIREVMEGVGANDIIRFEVDLATGPNWYTCK